MNEEEPDLKKSGQQVVKTAKAVKTGMRWLVWAKYIVPIGLILGGLFFFFLVIISLLSGGSDDGNVCYTENNETPSGEGFGGDWQDSKSDKHKAMQKAADKFKNDLHMSGDNIAAALAVGLRESQFNPKAVNPSGQVRGIWQWGAGSINGNRYKDTKDNVDSQVDLAIKELKTTHTATLSHMHNADLSHSLEAWDVNFEGLTASDPQRKQTQTLATGQKVKSVFKLDFSGSLTDLTGGDASTANGGATLNPNNCPPSTGTSSGLPIKGKYNITGGYPNYQGAGGSPHYGVDFQTVGAKESGEASNVYAVADGKVYAKTSDSTGGNYVVIKNNDGSYTYYGHAPSQSAIVVSKGDTVHKGQHISHQGQTGLATGVHVHFGVNKKKPAFAPQSDGLVSGGDYLSKVPRQAVPSKGQTIPAGPFSTDQEDKDKK